MRIVLLGPPASGKGTQGRRIASHLDLEYLSTGALLREAVEQETLLGLAAKPILAKGGYLPDDLMCPILSDWLRLHDTGEGWVLDGFPRSPAQAEFLQKSLSERNTALDFAIALDAPFEELIRRIHNRVECMDCRWTGQRAELLPSGKCPECSGQVSARADDDEDNFRSRHAEFVENTIPVIDFYETHGRLLKISASGNRDDTTSQILNHINLPADLQQSEA